MNKISDDELAEMIQTHEDVLRFGVLDYATIPAQEKFISALTELQALRRTLAAIDAELKKSYSVKLQANYCTSVDGETVVSVVLNQSGGSQLRHAPTLAEALAKLGEEPK